MGTDKRGKQGWFDHGLRYVGYLAIALIVPFVVAYVLSSRSHKYYYNRTIKNVQTADFNILSSTMPAKLSVALLERDSSEIDRTVNSNYGLFGVFVTDCKSPNGDCPGQKVTFQSRWRRPKSEPVYDGEMLRGQRDFSVLRSPPPIWTEWQYSGPDPDAVKIRTGLINTGAVIGRVYFVRSTPPRFWDNFVHDWFLGNLTKRPWGMIGDAWVGRNVHTSYALNLIVGILLASVIILAIKMRQIEKEKRRLAERERQSEEERRRIAELRSNHLNEQLADNEERLNIARCDLQEAERARADTQRELAKARDSGEAAEELFNEAAEREKAVKDQEERVSNVERKTLREQQEIRELLGAEPGKTTLETVADLIAYNRDLRKENKSSERKGEHFRERMAKWYENVTIEKDAMDWVLGTKRYDPTILEDFERQVMLLNFVPKQACWSRNVDEKTQAKTVYAPRDKYRVYVVEGDGRPFTIVRVGRARDPEKQRDHERLAELFPRR